MSFLDDIKNRNKNKEEVKEKEQKEKKPDYVGDIPRDFYGRMQHVQVTEAKEGEKQKEIVYEEEIVGSHSSKAKIKTVETAVNVKDMKGNVEPINMKLDFLSLSLAVRPDLTATYSRFETFFRTEYKNFEEYKNLKKHMGHLKMEWTENDFVMKFVYFMNARDDDFIMKMDEIRKFCTAFSQAEKKETVEDILKMTYQMMTQNEKNPLTKEFLQNKFNCFKKRSNEIFGKRRDQPRADPKGQDLSFWLLVPDHQAGPGYHRLCPGACQAGRVHHQL